MSKSEARLVRKNFLILYKEKKEEPILIWLTYVPVITCVLITINCRSIISLFSLFSRQVNTMKIGTCYQETALFSILKT